MNIKPETVRTLLETLVTPKFDDIVRYDIIVRQNDEGKPIVLIDVIMKHKLRFSKKEEYLIESRIINVMKYISPAFVTVEFYNTTDY